MKLISEQYFDLALGLTALIIVAKIDIFRRAKSKNRHLYNLLFYPPYDIINTNSSERKKLKLYQNLLTLIIVITLVMLYMDEIYMFIKKLQ